MNKPEQTKEQLIQAAIKLLNEGFDPENLSVRQIADEAGMTFGLINYHFGTKEYLIQQACLRIIDSKANEVKHFLLQSDSDPTERLRLFMKLIANSVMTHQSVMKVLIKQELMEGQFETINYIFPILKEIFPDATSENELKLLAFQLVIPLQYAFIRSEQVNKLFSFNSIDTSSVDWLIDRSINNLLRRI